MQYALDALNTFTAARVAAADAAVEQADKEVSAAQSALDAELEARANGYANNVVQAQKELDLAKEKPRKSVERTTESAKTAGSNTNIAANRKHGNSNGVDMVAIRFPVCNTCNCRNVGEFCSV